MFSLDSIVRIRFVASKIAFDTMVFLFATPLEIVFLASNLASAETECPTVCPFILAPTCASAPGNTDPSQFHQFANRCILDVYNCKHPDNGKYVWLHSCNSLSNIGNVDASAHPILESLVILKIVLAPIEAENCRGRQYESSDWIAKVQLSWNAPMKSCLLCECF